MCNTYRNDFQMDKTSGPLQACTQIIYLHKPNGSHVDMYRFRTVRFIVQMRSSSADEIAAQKTFRYRGVLLHHDNRSVCNRHISCMQPLQDSSFSPLSSNLDSDSKRRHTQFKEKTYAAMSRHSCGGWETISSTLAQYNSGRKCY